MDAQLRHKDASATFLDNGPRNQRCDDNIETCSRKLNWSEAQDEPNSVRTRIWRNTLFDEFGAREVSIEAALFVIRDLYNFDRQRHVGNARSKPMRIVALRPGDKGQYRAFRVARSTRNIRWGTTEPP